MHIGRVTAQRLNDCTSRMTLLKQISFWSPWPHSWTSMLHLTCRITSYCFSHSTDSISIIRITTGLCQWLTIRTNFHEQCVAKLCLRSCSLQPLHSIVVRCHCFMWLFFSQICQWDLAFWHFYLWPFSVSSFSVLYCRCPYLDKSYKLMLSTDKIKLMYVGLSKIDLTSPAKLICCLQGVQNSSA